MGDCISVGTEVAVDGVDGWEMFVWRNNILMAAAATSLTLAATLLVVAVVVLLRKREMIAVSFMLSCHAVVTAVLADCCFH